MSLDRLFLRIATVKALGASILGAVVKDSDEADMTSLETDLPTPVLRVFTDEQRWTFKGKDFYGPDLGHIVLTIEIALSGYQQGHLGPNNEFVPGPPEEGQDPASRYFTPESSAGLELAIDIMESQCEAALTSPSNPWAQVWMDFVVGFGKGQSLRGGSQQQGTRFAARQINLEVMTRGSPTPGRAPTATYQRMLDLLASDPDSDYAGAVPMLRAAIAGQPLPIDGLIARQGGISQGTAMEIGIVPLGPVLSEGIVDPDGLSTSNTEIQGAKETEVQS